MEAGAVPPKDEPNPRRNFCCVGHNSFYLKSLPVPEKSPPDEETAGAPRPKLNPALLVCGCPKPKDGAAVLVCVPPKPNEGAAVLVCVVPKPNDGAAELIWLPNPKVGAVDVV